MSLRQFRAKHILSAIPTRDPQTMQTGQILVRNTDAALTILKSRQSDAVNQRPRTAARVSLLNENGARVSAR